MFLLFPAVAIDREARVFFRRYMGDLFDSGRGETVEPNTMKGFFRATTSVLPGRSVAAYVLDFFLASNFIIFSCQDVYLCFGYIFSLQYRRCYFPSGEVSTSHLAFTCTCLTRSLLCLLIDL